MELTLTVHLPRRRPEPVDVVVRWCGEHTADRLCDVLGDHLGVRVAALAVRGHPVPGSARVGSAPLLHGASVTAVEQDGGVPSLADRDSRSPSVLELVVVGGPDAGRSRLLTPPGLSVGRSVPSGLSLGDDALSRTHASVDVDPSGVVVRDADSTNGVTVDGRRITAPTRLDSTSTVVLGSSTLRVRRLPGAGLPVREVGDGRQVLRTDPLWPAPAEDMVVDAPPAPPDRQRTRVPWVAALLPVPVALALAAFLGPHLLAFALLGPVLLLGTALGDRLGASRAHRRTVEEHAAATSAARAEVRRLLREEAARLDAGNPDPHAVLRAAEGRLPGLWSRGDLRVRLGLGDVPTRVVWRDGPHAERPPAQHAPVVTSLEDTAGLTVRGSQDRVRPFLAGIVGQLVVGCPPSVLRLAVVSDDPRWRWVARVPHATAPPPGMAGPREVQDPGPPRAPQHDPGSPKRVLVVPECGGETAEVVTRARAAGWVVVVGDPDSLGAPAAGPVLDLTDDPVMVTGGDRLAFVPDRVGSWWTDRISRALAPLHEDGTDDDGSLPVRVTLADLLGADALVPSGVTARWVNGRGRPRAPVGRCPDGIHVLDLVADGPHVLIGGTTGSGKSESLRTLVMSLALSASPEDLALVLVDFKGGAAFGSCEALPHVAGVLTDLDEHLVERALSSLRAELRRRERLFAQVGANDLEAYRERPDRPEPLPRLVVVVDELKALVDAVPQFVDGLVRLAALGRSLGVHLVLATQRPTGALGAEVRANVNLRVAFRVMDRTDSVDVIDDTSAAGIDPSLPGRAVARGGDGRLVTFQAAVIARREPAPAPFLRVEPFDGRAPNVGGVRTDGRASDDGGAGTEVGTEVGTDDALDELVAAVVSAAALTSADQVRRPWLAPLPAHLTPLRDDSSTSSVMAGLLDEPEHQRMSPVRWTAETGTWLLSGSPRSGRTTAARALALSAVAMRSPGDVHLHVVDPSASLADLRVLPHVGTVVTGENRRALLALVEHLEALVRTRRPTAGVRPGDGADRQAIPSWPTTVVLVDGWDQVAERSDAADPTLDRLLAVLRDGASVGVRGIVTGGRVLLQPRWSGLGDHVLLLGRIEPLEAALAGLRPVDLPSDPPRGRGVRVADRREVQMANAHPGTTRVLARRWSAAGVAGVREPWRYRPLPALARRPTAPTAPTAATAAGRADRIGLGLRTTQAGPEPWEWRLESHGRTLVVAGPPRSGRSTSITVVAEEVLANGGHALLVSRSRTTVVARPGLTVVSPEDATTFVLARRRYPGVAVLVDDADRLDEGPLLPLLREVRDLLDRDGGLMAVATTTSALSTRFRGIDVEAARHGAVLLLAPRPSDGQAVGRGRLPEVPVTAGRGLVIGVEPDPVELQVYAPRGSGLLVDPGGQRVDAPGGECHERGDECHGDQPPAQQPQAALDHPAADREQQRAPDDRRGPGPRGVTEPRPGEGAEPHGEDGDEEGRHHDPDRVAALPDDQLVEVEDGEAEEGHGLQTGEHGGGTAGAA